MVLGVDEDGGRAHIVPMASLFSGEIYACVREEAPALSHRKIINALGRVGQTIPRYSHSLMYSKLRFAGGKRR